MQKIATKCRTVKLIAPLDEASPELPDSLFQPSPPVLGYGSPKTTHLGAWLEDSARWAHMSRNYTSPDLGLGHAYTCKSRLSSIADVSESQSESGSSAQTRGLSPSTSQKTMSRQNSGAVNSVGIEDAHSAARRSLEQSRAVEIAGSSSPNAPKAKQKASKFVKFFR